MRNEDSETSAFEINIPVSSTQAQNGGYAFERFSFFPTRQLLLENGIEIKLGSRALTILTVLIERAGEVVTKEELLHAVWPSRRVEESNLRVHIGAIRKALGEESEHFLSNVVGRGYQFVAPVQMLIPPSESQPDEQKAPVSHGLPHLLTRVLGRAEAVNGILQLLRKHRLVSIVGSGGIGKTTIALVAAQRMSDEFQDGTFFVDLATVSKPHHVVLAVAAALNFSVETDDALASLVSHLRTRKSLLILDNCEHVIEAAATITLEILKGSIDVKVLTTTHEPLRTEGEWLFRLQPLGLPSEGSISTLTEAMTYPSVELFIERVNSADQELIIDDNDVRAIIKICRRLDGIPLAIEMAAAQVNAFGIASLAEGLGSRLDILTGGRRTAAQRHQTIRSMHDWSYENLSQSERAVLRRVSIFADTFSVNGVKMLFEKSSLEAPDIVENIAGLVRKSLLYPKRGDRSVSYRMLESTKMYALEKLGDAGELSDLRDGHVRLVIDMLEHADAEWKDVPRVTWLSRYSGLLSEVRAALGWAFASGEMIAAGIKLTSLAIPLGIQLGLVDEFRERAEAALSHAREAEPRECIAEMRINLIHGILGQNQIKPSDSNERGLMRAADLAEQIGADRYKLEPQIVLAAFTMGTGDYARARMHAERAEELSANLDDDLAVLASRRIMAQVSHFKGDHALALTLARSVIAHPIVNIPTAYGSVQIDRRVSMRVIMARAMWMQGDVDQALPVVRDATEAARDDGPLGLCQALALSACPILLWRGDFDAAGAAAEALIEHSSRFTLRHWNSWGRVFQKIVERRMGWQPGSSGNLIGEGGFQLQTLATLNSQLDGLDDIGLADHGWSGPEVLRARGERLSALKDHAAAEKLFIQSMLLARRQGAISWELRAVLSLARLWREAGKQKEAIAALTGVYQRFSEGFDTADLAHAGKLMVELRT